MKKLTTRFIAMAACAAFAFSFGQAAPDDSQTPDPETAAAVKTLMKTLKVEEQMAPVMAGMRQMQGNMINRQELSDEEKTSALELMAASMEEVEKAMSWGNLEGIMVRAYASVFTTEEVEDLNEMFLSPAGQTFVKKQPQLQAATMKEMQSIMVELLPKIQEKAKEAIERAKAKQAAQN